MPITSKKITNKTKWAIFWSYAGERALKTFSQTMLAMIVVSASDSIGVPLGILDVNWTTILSVSILATIVSLLTSIVRKQDFHYPSGILVTQQKVLEVRNARL
jgi:hypothetical protein